MGTRVNTAWEYYSDRWEHEIIPHGSTIVTGWEHELIPHGSTIVTGWEHELIPHGSTRLLGVFALGPSTIQGILMHIQ
jgi:hypothetical protein